MKILFICKYNAFRSRAAEAYFRKLNNDKRIHVSSAGFIDGGSADKVQREIAKKLLDVDIRGKITYLSLDLLRKQDLVVIVAKDVPKIMFNNSYGYGKTKFVYWGIKDEQLLNKKNVKVIVKKIKKRVERLIKNLN